MSELNINGSFDDEFEAIMRPIEEAQSEEAIWDEWQIYSREDAEFRAVVVSRIAELTGVKTGRELFNGEQA